MQRYLRLLSQLLNRKVVLELSIAVLCPFVTLEKPVIVRQL